MPKEIKGTTYYLSGEACEMANISRGTLLRWIKQGLIPDAQITDRNGWRLFTEADLKKIQAVSQKTRKA